MSEPVTNVEIEDVLSSIRRLVSAGEEGNSPAKSEESHQDQASAPPPRFVLTPAFRVTEPDDDIESTAEKDETTIVFGPEIDDIAEPMDAASQKRSARDSLEATIAELEAAVIQQPDEWEPDGSEVTTIPTWDTVSYPPLDEVEDAVAVEETTPEDMRGDAPRFVEGDPFILAQQDETEDEPDALDPILTSGPFIAEDAVYSANDPLPVAEDEDRFADTQNVETLTFARSQPIPMADDPSEDYGDDLLPDPDPVGEDDDLDAYMLGNGQGINEEILRQMVMDVVREELQGNLGERITRNVRKMVRREIHRALDMQNFD